MWWVGSVDGGQLLTQPEKTPLSHLVQMSNPNKEVLEDPGQWHDGVWAVSP